MTIPDEGITEDIGDSEFVEKRKTNSRLAQKSRSDLMAAIVSMPEGRKWIWELLTELGVFSNPFSADGLVMAFKCGEQNVGQRIFADVLEASPDAYLTMVKESRE
jgi:hypothetical protein